MGMTYTQLSTAIQQYTENNETSFVANIPNFIKNTEILVNNTVQLPAARKNVTGACDSGFQYLDLPNDFLSVFSIAVQVTELVNDVSTTVYHYLLNKDVNYIREAFPYPAVQGVPTHYGLFDNSALLLGPTPDDAYVVELHYYSYPVSIVDSPSGTSWLGDNFPNLLLYGALVEGYTYMKGEQDMIQMYQNKYSEALGTLKQLADGKNREDNFRTTQVRDTVV
jgi:hypothetical protein